MAISRAQLAKELEPGLNALFGQSYDQYDREYEEIYELKVKVYRLIPLVKVSLLGIPTIQYRWLFRSPRKLRKTTFTTV